MHSRFEIFNLQQFYYRKETLNLVRRQHEILTPSFFASRRTRQTTLCSSAMKGAVAGVKKDGSAVVAGLEKAADRRSREDE